MIDPTPLNIVALRNRHNLTQSQCAAAVGVSWRTWQNWELLGTMPKCAWWLLLLRLGEITVADLPQIPARQRRAAYATK